MTNGEKLCLDFPDVITRKFKIEVGSDYIEVEKADVWVADFDMSWWNSEYKEPTTKENLGVDCIDRNSIKYYPGQGGYMYASKGEIDKLPSVTSIRPKSDDANEVLNKLRAEIEQLPTSTCTETCRISIDADDFKEKVLDIFDKYKAKTEEVCQK